MVKQTHDALKEGKSFENESKKLLSNLDLALSDATELNRELGALNDNAEKILPMNEEDYKKLATLVEEGKFEVFKVFAQNNILFSWSIVLGHAISLSGKRDNLSDQYSNITANSNDAIKAVNAYAEIDHNVEIARNSSNLGHNNANAALKLTNGMAERAAKSHQESSELNREGHSALSNVQLELSPNLRNASDNVQKIKQDLESVASKLKSINGSVDSIKVEPLTDTWQVIQDEAVDSNGLVQKSNTILEPISKKLPASTELSQKIPKDVEDTNKDISQALNQVSRVDELVPNILGAMDNLEEKQKRLDSLNSQIGDDLDRLRRHIEQARSLANSIKVGVNFLPNTTLELKTPENLQSQTFNTKLSTYFKTTNPNGLLLYLGNEPKPGARGKRDDFMAIEIENGYPVLLVDVGDGPERIISNKLVHDGRWYEAIVERAGKNVKFTIREEDDDGNEKLILTEHELQGEQINFDLDENSRLFIGGNSDYNMPKSINQHQSFEGEVEGLKIGESDVGLWNFLDGQNNYGAMERDRLVTKEAKHTGYRFGGNGHVVLDARPYNFKQRSTVSFKFKAGRDSPNGLLFFVGHENHYISLELKGGNVVFQFKMGQTSEVVEIKTENAFNDDEYHKVEATRDGGNGGLNVDGVIIYQQTLYVAENYPAPDKMYFGGYPDRPFTSQVTSKNFDGCIDEVHIEGTPIDLSRNIQSQDVLPGCPMKFSSVVAFSHDKFGYLKSRNLTVNNKLHINLKFKTLQSKGIIFYGMNNDQSATITLALDDGILVLRSSRMELNTDARKFNDGQWHVVTATHDERKLRLYIDDIHEFTSSDSPPALQISYGEIYFGGLPKFFKPIQNGLPNEAYFVGCIQDVTINTNVINFASSTDKLNAILNSCPRDILDYNIAEIPFYFPDGSIEKVKAHSTESRIDADEDDKDNMIPSGHDDELQAKPPPITTEKIAITTVKPQPTTEKTTLRPKPVYTEDQKHPLCELPVIPDYNVDFESAGYRFGTSPNSYIEIESSPDQTQNNFVFSLAFRTAQQNGLLFYASDERHTDFVSVYLKDGYLHYVFACNGAAIAIDSKNQYDNHEWQSIEFSRKGAELLLKTESEQQNNKLEKKCRTMDLKPSYFVGGSNNLEDIELNLNKKEKGFFTKNPFFGCIKDIKLNALVLNTAVPPSEGVLPCSDDIETGVFFGKSGGYVKLREKFRVGNDLTISMDIKPRNLTGVLTSVHGKKSFFIVEMIKGDIHFTVDSGDGPRSAVFKPDEDKSLCDGKWHTGKHCVALRCKKL